MVQEMHAGVVGPVELGILAGSWGKCGKAVGIKGVQLSLLVVQMFRKADRAASRSLIRLYSVMSTD